jgi:hypothetical protein
MRVVTDLSPSRTSGDGIPVAAQGDDVAGAEPGCTFGRSSGHEIGVPRRDVPEHVEAAGAVGARVRID